MTFSLKRRFLRLFYLIPSHLIVAVLVFVFSYSSFLTLLDENYRLLDKHSLFICADEVVK